MSGDVRAVALKTLLSGSEEGELRRAASGLSERDRGLFVELVRGVRRRRTTLDLVLAEFARARSLPPRTHLILILGIYQLLYLGRIPAHAAVNGSVELAGGRRTRGFVNAVLRAVERAARPVQGDEAERRGPDLLRTAHGRGLLFDRPLFPDPATEPVAWLAAQESFSEEAVRLFTDEFGFDRSVALLRSANLPPALTLRVTARTGSPSEFAPALEREGLHVEPVEGHPESMYRLVGGGDPVGTELFRAGRFTIQGLHAARVVPLLQPRPGESGIDLCAAPGGKTAQLAERIAQGRVLACTLGEKGRRRLKGTLGRLGCENVDIASISKASPIPVVSRATILLLDVPCSNSGVLARRPEARQRLAAAPMASLERVQRSLLERGLDWLAQGPRGARLVYSTCSVFRRENGDLVRGVLEARPGFGVDAEIRSFPGDAWSDGGYAARIVRR